MRQVRTRTRRNYMELRQRRINGVGQLVSPGVDGDNKGKMI